MGSESTLACSEQSVKKSKIFKGLFQVLLHFEQSEKKSSEQCFRIGIFKVKGVQKGESLVLYEKEDSQ